MNDKTLEEIRNLAVGILNDRARRKANDLMYNNLQSTSENNVSLTVGDAVIPISRNFHHIMREVISASTKEIDTEITQKENRLREILQKYFCKYCERYENEDYSVLDT